MSETIITKQVHGLDVPNLKHVDTEDTDPSVRGVYAALENFDKFCKGEENAYEAAVARTAEFRFLAGLRKRNVIACEDVVRVVEEDYSGVLSTFAGQTALKFNLIREAFGPDEGDVAVYSAQLIPSLAKKKTHVLGALGTVLAQLLETI